MRCALIVATATAWVLVPSAPALAAPAYSTMALNLNPAAYWRLGETSGTTAVDASKNGRDATYEGDTHLGLPGAIASDPNTSVGFDGVDDDAVWYPDSSYQGAFTVVAWIDNTGATAFDTQTFFDTRTAYSEYSFDFKLSDGNLQVDVGDGCCNWFVTGPGIPFDFQPNSWYQVAAVITQTAATLYVNGSSIGTLPYTDGTGDPLLYDWAHPVYLGTNARYTTEPFLGRMDEVAMYLRPLSTKDIGLLYTVGSAGRPT